MLIYFFLFIGDEWQNFKITIRDEECGMKLPIPVENYQKAYIVTFLLSVVLALVFLFLLPDQVPMQWAMDGSVNYTLPKYLAVLVMPVITAFLVARGWNQFSFVYLGWCFANIVIISGIFIFIIFTY